MPNSPNSCAAHASPQCVGDPVDTLTGAVYDQQLDFRLTGPLELWWQRHYDSSQSHRRFALGWGHTHSFDRTLTLHQTGIKYSEPVGQEYDFPQLMNPGDQIALHGLFLTRLSGARYRLVRHGEPAMEFEFFGGQSTARLGRVFEGEHQILFRYDDFGRLVKITDCIGRCILVHEDPDGTLHGLIWELGSGGREFPLLHYTYDERGNLIKTRNQFGNGHSYVYDDANRLTCRIGRMGIMFHFLYDEQGRCIRSMGDDRLYGVALEYRVPGRLTVVERPDGGVWTYTFDAKSRLIKIVDGQGGIQRFIRDAVGRVLIESDQNENPTRLIYDEAGALIEKRDAFGRFIEVPENVNALPPDAHYVAWNPLEYQYGLLLPPEDIVVPSPADAAALSLPVYSDELVECSVPDGSAAVDPLFEVKPLRFMWWPTPKQGRIFNDFGQLIQQRDHLGRSRRWSYDASGNVSQYVDFDGGTWSYDTGRWHFLLGITNPLGTEVRYSYTTSGEIASCTDAGGTLSEYGYDLNDHLIEVRRHGRIRERYTLDPAGNLIAKHDGEGRELLRIENGPGNLPTKRTLASGDEHQFAYDDSGRCVRNATLRDDVEFRYDEMGNRVFEKRNGLGIENRFSGWRRRTQAVMLDRFTVHYQPLRAGRFAVVDPGGKAHEIEYGEAGIFDCRFSNGSREIAQYDPMGRCLFKSVAHAKGKVWNRRYHWSGEGELRRVEDNLLGEVRHEYDAAHRLSGRIVHGELEIYRMDAADNLLEQPGLTDVQLQPGNRLQCANGAEFTYNGRNHVEARVAASGTVRYCYDSFDQLIRVEMPTGVWSAQYDGLGRRTRKTWCGQTTEFYWNSDQLIAEVQPSGRVRLYIYAHVLALTPILFVDYDSLDVAPEQCRRYFIFSDQIGTPCLIEDERGEVVWRAGIQPFGVAQVSANAKVEFNLRFPGHYLDAELGLHYNRFRYYDPVLGRYLQSDPWGISGGVNLYAYRTNPLFSVDARGLGDQGTDTEEPVGDRPQNEETENGQPPGKPPRTWDSFKDYSPHQSVVDSTLGPDNVYRLGDPWVEKKRNYRRVFMLDEEGTIKKVREEIQLLDENGEVLERWRERGSESSGAEGKGPVGEAASRITIEEGEFDGMVDVNRKPDTDAAKAAKGKSRIAIEEENLRNGSNHGFDGVFLRENNVPENNDRSAAQDHPRFTVVLVEVKNKSGQLTKAEFSAVSGDRLQNNIQTLVNKLISSPDSFESLDEAQKQQVASILTGREKGQIEVQIHTMPDTELGHVGSTRSSVIKDLQTEANALLGLPDDTIKFVHVPMTENVTSRAIAEVQARDPIGENLEQLKKLGELLRRPSE